MNIYRYRFKLATISKALSDAHANLEALIKQSPPELKDFDQTQATTAIHRAHREVGRIDHELSKKSHEPPHQD